MWVCEKVYPIFFDNLLVGELNVSVENIKKWQLNYKILGVKKFIL